MRSIRAAAESHTGYVRTQNEDLAVVSPDIAAIADGMGGHLGGEVAARTAIEELLAAFGQDRSWEGLLTAVKRANGAIWKRSHQDRSLHGMGTTLTAAALVEGEGDGERRLALVNVGDSRAYKVNRLADPPRLSRLTEDHSVVEEMVRQGELSEAEAAVHPHRHVLTRALGIDPGVDVDIWELEPENGLRILLCSDGLSDDVPEEEIESALTSSEDPRQAAQELVRTALAHGGRDNVTVVVVDVVEEPDPVDEQPLEFAPVRPQWTESGADRMRADVTQALPVAEAPKSDGASGEATAAVDMASLIATGVGAEVTPGAGEAGSDPTLKSARLFDADAEQPPEPSQNGTDLDGKTGPSEAPPRRRGRSLTVTAAPPSSPASQAEATGAHPRAQVLVPASRITKQYRDRVLTVRVVLFVLVLAGLLGGVIAVVIWFQRSSYYVGLSGNRVSIFQGRPGGLWVFKPQLLETSSLTTSNLLPNTAAEVKKGIAETSYAAARQQVADLGKLAAQIGRGPKASSGTTTTSTTPAGKSSLRATPGAPMDATFFSAVVSVGDSTGGAVVADKRTVIR